MNVPLTERVANFVHKAVASSLILFTAGGLVFVGSGASEIYGRYKRRRELAARQLKQSKTTTKTTTQTNSTD